MYVIYVYNYIDCTKVYKTTWQHVCSYVYKYTYICHLATQ